MKDNQEIVILSVVILMAFAIFIINRIRFQNKKRNKTLSKKEIIRRSIINTLSDMESDGVYFNRENGQVISKDYIKKFKKRMKGG